jgi:hypothetical protein
LFAADSDISYPEASKMRDGKLQSPVWENVFVVANQVRGCQEARTSLDTIRKISLAPPSVEASPPTGHPRSRFADNCRRACLLPIRLSQVMVRVGFDDRAELLPAAPDVYHGHSLTRQPYWMPKDIFLLSTG